MDTTRPRSEKKDSAPATGPGGAREGDTVTERALGLPSITVPKGGGAVRRIDEKFSANPVTGTGTLAIALPLSPSRSGFEPKLNLQYDSGSGNGPFGMGWTVGLPAITRKTDKGLPRYLNAQESDVFILSGAEDLVPVPGSGVTRVVHGVSYDVHAYRPRVEGLFARVELWRNPATGGSHWRSITSDNVTTLYGFDPDSRVAAPDAPQNVFSYLISRTFDDKGNITVFHYALEDESQIDVSLAHEANRTSVDRRAQRYIKRVLYGNAQPYFADWTDDGDEPPLPANWHFELVVDYGDHTLVAPAPGTTHAWPVRPDPFSRYRAGFELRTYRRCSRILMFHNFPAEPEVGTGCLVRSLDLQYSDERDPTDAHNPAYTFLCAATQTGYRRNGDGYVAKSLPPVEFEYSQPQIQSDVRTLDHGDLANLPQGIDGRSFQWLDLDGDGLGGTLTELPGGAWGYKRNLNPLADVVRADGSHISPARMGALETIETLPSRSDFSGQQFLDLGGDGMLDVATFAGPMPGFFQRCEEGGWKPFRAFRQLPQIDWNASNLKFVDLTGDGLADVLLTQDDAFICARSLGEDGYGELETLPLPWDEDRGPKLVSGDETQAILLADMTGDGLSDLVRVRNREICYWPNLGYGRFGAKVSMDKAPNFAPDDQFDAARVRFADIDGSGTADVLYVGADGVWVSFNRSGNSWAEPRRIAVFPAADSLASVQVYDLLGNGTACLVWSSPLPEIAGESLRYVDLVGGQKPHLMVTARNNLGAETRLGYAPSTRFYLVDKYTGRPWITRIPFVVQVVERIETYDFIGRSRFTTLYAYHHGHFDGFEREFRGFGMVEQWDTEEYRDDATFLPAATNWAPSSWNPPIHTKTWFHTGAFTRAPAVSRQYASEYWAGDSAATALADTVLPAGLTAQEQREAYRALKGTALRVEVYADDRNARAPIPYSVAETNFTVDCLQPIGSNRHAVFFVHPRESLTFHYERQAHDPRVTHDVVLEVNAFGGVRRSLSVAYPRRSTGPAAGVPPAFTGMLAYDQARLHIGATELRYTNAFADATSYRDIHRAPRQSESIAAELTGIAPAAGPTKIFAFDELDTYWATLWDGTHDIPYEEVPASDVDGSGTPSAVAARRIVERQRTLYRADNLSGLLGLDVLEPMALPGESYRLAFTPRLVTRIYGTRVSDAVLAEGGYVKLAPDPNWWIPSGRTFYSSGDADAANDECTAAMAHFFAPRRMIDPFGAISRVDPDGYDLLPRGSTDALGNATIAVNDYRVLAPSQIADPNGNRTAFAFDAMGMLVGMAVMGKASEALGDTLTGFVADLDDATVAAHLAAPLNNPDAILGNATSRLIYDPAAYWRTKNDAAPAPPVTYTLAREIHVSDLAGATTPYRHSFVYSDGLAREIQHKIQAEPGPLVVDGPELSTRWVGSGWTIFDNKGNAVRKYEPFFSATQDFEFAATTGVSSTVFYDPAGRAVATLHPDSSWEKTVFDPWRQTSWDGNDTVLADPTADADVGDHFVRALGSGAFSTWYNQRIGGTFGTTPETRAAENAAALKAAPHAATPLVTHFDSRGRVCLTVADNGGGEFHATRAAPDVEDKPLAVTDALGRRTEEYCLREAKTDGGFVYVAGYDMAGNALYRNNMDAGERRVLTNVAGHPVRAWDARANVFRSVYDLLQRLTHLFVSSGDGAETLADRLVYGEGLPASNLCGRLFRHYDAAGISANERYDYKGNLVESSRQFAANYRGDPDWMALSTLTSSIDLDAAALAKLDTHALYRASTRYDALNRPVQSVTPHSATMRPSVMRLGYNVAGLAERVDVWVREATEPAGLLDPAAAGIHAVTNIDYNARGQRIAVSFGSGAVSAHEYDPKTFRLARLTTARPAPTPADQRVVQDLAYTYDPIGNVCAIRDAADTQNVVFFRNRRVQPSSDYTYDPLYRLTKASGREHLGQTGSAMNAPAQPTNDDSPRMRIAQPGDGNAMDVYTENYGYDAVGNLLTMVHSTASGGWTRRYDYREPSRIVTAERGNRLTATSLPGDLADGPYTARYAYDAHGSMTVMPHLPLMVWDTHDRLRATARQVVNNGTPDTTFYVYDADGQRLRKTTDRAAASGDGVRRSERIYLGALEIYREYGADGIAVTLERETLHVSSGAAPEALIETRTLGSDPAPVQMTRYQHGNHLGSSVLELDDRADIISYEEYFSYGGTSYQAVRSQQETPKRYRYTGMERDEENDLNYHGARYYAPWLGRWVSCDPIGIEDGDNLYLYCQSNPVGHRDRTGLETEDGGDNGTAKADPQTNKLSAKIYFRFDNDVVGKDKDTGKATGLTPAEQQKYIDDFKANVLATWAGGGTFQYNGKNLDLKDVVFAPESARKNGEGYLITVGNGASDTNKKSDPAEADNNAKISYVKSKDRVGYMYLAHRAGEAAHEFGHLFGLSDRYHEGVYRNGNQLEGRFSVTMKLKGFTDGQTNLYGANSAGAPTISQEQLDIVFANKTERTYPTAVIIAEKGKKLPYQVKVGALGRVREYSGKASSGHRTVWARENMRGGFSTSSARTRRGFSYTAGYHARGMGHWGRDLLKGLSKEDSLRNQNRTLIHERSH